MKQEIEYLSIVALFVINNPDNGPLWPANSAREVPSSCPYNTKRGLFKQFIVGKLVSVYPLNKPTPKDPSFRFVLYDNGSAKIIWGNHAGDVRYHLGNDTLAINLDSTKVSTFRFCAISQNGTGTLIDETRPIHKIYRFIVSKRPEGY